MKSAVHFGYVCLIVLAVVGGNHLTRAKIDQQTTALGEYTKYLAAQIIKNVKTSCDSPGI